MLCSSPFYPIRANIRSDQGKEVSMKSYLNLALIIKITMKAMIQRCNYSCVKTREPKLTRNDEIIRQ